MEKEQSKTQERKKHDTNRKEIQEAKKGSRDKNDQIKKQARM